MGTVAVSEGGVPVYPESSGEARVEDTFQNENKVEPDEEPNTEAINEDRNVSLRPGSATSSKLARERVPIFQADAMGR